MPSLPIIYNPDYVTPLPPGHRFPMSKFGKVYEHLVRDGIAALDQFHCPQLPDRSVLELVHTADYVTAYLSGTLDGRAMRRIGFPWSPELVHRTCTAVGGTILAAVLALQEGIACNTAGGTHHAHASFGSGFCIFNDMAVAARYVQEAGLADRVLLLDLDVHQGDGSAAIFQDDPRVFTFSMHCAQNFPFRKQKSTLDVPLPQGTGDRAYLATLGTHLPEILADFRPDLVLYDGGVDPHVEDKLGKLALSSAGLLERDTFVFSCCAQQHIPVAAVIGGGYQADHDRLARRHTLLHQAATTIFQAVYG